jgi:hypothetical protein
MTPMGMEELRLSLVETAIADIGDFVFGAQ